MAKFLRKLSSLASRMQQVFTIRDTPQLVRPINFLLGIVNWEEWNAGEVELALGIVVGYEPNLLWPTMVVELRDLIWPVMEKCEAILEFRVLDYLELLCAVCWSWEIKKRKQSIQILTKFVTIYLTKFTIMQPLIRLD